MTDQLIPDDLLTRTKVITGLRQLADFLEAHPGVPVGRYGWDRISTPTAAKTIRPPAPRWTGSPPSSASRLPTRPGAADTTSLPGPSA